MQHEIAHKIQRVRYYISFLAHDYEKIDYLIICEEALEKLDDIVVYLAYIEKKLI